MHQVQIYQIFDSSKTAYIVMELCLGGRLRDYIRRMAPSDAEGLPEPEARRLFIQLVTAVDYMHSKGIALRLILELMAVSL